MDPRATHRRLRSGAAWLALAFAALVPLAAAQERAPSLPFSYVGTVDRDSERYAVVAARDQSVLLVRAGETINNEYRVHSIGERLRLVSLASGRVYELALGLPGGSGAPAAPPPEPPREPRAAQESATETPASAPAGEGARPGYEH